MRIVSRIHAISLLAADFCAHSFMNSARFFAGFVSYCYYYFYYRIMRPQNV